VIGRQEQAVSTFNFLCAEKRYVAGAFIPPTKVEMADDEVYLQDNIDKPQRDMINVMQRMARLKGEEQMKKLPDDTDNQSEK